MLAKDKKRKSSKVSITMELDLEKPDEATAYRLCQILKPESYVNAVKPGIIRKLLALGKELLGTCQQEDKSLISADAQNEE